MSDGGQAFCKEREMGRSRVGWALRGFRAGTGTRADDRDGRSNALTHTQHNAQAQSRQISVFKLTKDDFDLSTLLVRAQ